MAGYAGFCVEPGGTVGCGTINASARLGDAVGIGLSARAAGAIIAGRARPGRRAHRSTAGVEGPSTDAVDGWRRRRRTARGGDIG